MVDAAARRSGCPASRRARSTPTRCASCATSGRAATTARRCPEILDSKAADRRPARAPAARATTGSRRRRTSPTRSSGRSRGGSRRAQYEAEAAARARAADPGRPVRARLRRLRAGEGAAGPHRLRRPAASGRSTCSRRDEDAAATVRARKRWFSVDEYQDTNPLQQRLLELWLGDRRDLCVVGDEDQTIYTFTGATSDVPDRLRRRATRARARSTLVAQLPLARRRSSRSRTGCSRPRAARSASWPRAPTGPSPRSALRATPTRSSRRWSPAIRDAARRRGSRRRRSRSSSASTPSSPPIEAALTRAGIPYRVRGQRFFDRPEVRDARRGAPAPAGARRARASGASRARPRALDARTLGLRGRTATAEGERGARARGVARHCCSRSSTRRSRRRRDIESPALLAELDAPGRRRARRAPPTA